MHDFVYSLCVELGDKIPNIAIAYNAYGAGASINHLHFQTFIMQQSLPVLGQQWQHNGGNTPYSTSCKVFNSGHDAWQYIDKLHRINVTYNLIYLPDKIVCLPRKYQGTYNLPQWTENFAWYELCGGITTFNQNDFQKLEDESIYTALSALNLSSP